MDFYMIEFFRFFEQSDMARYCAYLITLVLPIVLAFVFFPNRIDLIRFSLPFSIYLFAIWTIVYVGSANIHKQHSDILVNKLKLESKGEYEIVFKSTQVLVYKTSETGQKNNDVSKELNIDSSEYKPEKLGKLNCKTFKNEFDCVEKFISNVKDSQGKLENSENLFVKGENE